MGCPVIGSWLRCKTKCVRSPSSTGQGLMLMCVPWRASSLLATGCICLLGKQPHHRPDFCLNRKQNVVQWKGPGPEHHLNPVWFGDKLKSTERKIKGKEWDRAEQPAILPNYFMTLLLEHLAKLHNNSKPLWSGADCLFQSLDGDTEHFCSASEWPFLCVRCALALFFLFFLKVPY